MTTYSFANLDAWAEKVQARADAIVRDATQTTIGQCQVPRGKGGAMPVDTGFLRNSLKSSLEGSTSLTGPDSHVLVAGNMEAGDVATFTWGAEYAAAVNNGNRGRPGAHFREKGTDNWRANVRASTAKAQTAVG